MNYKQWHEEALKLHSQGFSGRTIANMLGRGKSQVNDFLRSKALQTNPLDSDNTKVEVLRLVNDGVDAKTICEQIGIDKASLSSFLDKTSYSDWWGDKDKPLASGSLYDHHHNIRQGGVNKKYIITSAQNSTFVHANFLSSLETMAERVGAQIIVGTFSYNLSGFQNLEKKEGEWFDNKIKDYILDEPLQLAKDLVWCGELNILPTATNPLSGFHSYTKDSSGIIPHAKVQLESFPSKKGGQARMLYTTGAITQRNYVQKKAGQKASFHHIFGALIVEVDVDGDWFVRQLICDADTGNFYDLDVLYTPQGAFEGQSVEAINWGDIHAEKRSILACEVSFGGNGSMLNTLKPRYQFVHDVVDFSSRNHHNISDPYFRFKQYCGLEDSVISDIKAVGEVLKEMQRGFSEVVVVESNHDLALTRWLKSADYKTDPANAVFFLDCQLATYKAMKENDRDFCVLRYSIENYCHDKINAKFLKTDESFVICGGNGVECGMHGDLGANGSRGSALGFTRLGSRVNIGHSHSARIIDGVYQAGTLSELDMGYNRGPSNWSHSNIITYKNGKRQIVTIKNGKWRAV